MGRVLKVERRNHAVLVMVKVESECVSKLDRSSKMLCVNAQRVMELDKPLLLLVKYVMVQVKP